MSTHRTQTTPPPPYTGYASRNAPHAGILRRTGGGCTTVAATRVYAPNAGVAEIESRATTAASTPSRRQAETKSRRTASGGGSLATSNSGPFMTKLTCAMLVIALLVSCAAFVLALVTLMTTTKSTVTAGESKKETDDEVSELGAIYDERFKDLLDWASKTKIEELEAALENIQTLEKRISSIEETVREMGEELRKQKNASKTSKRESRIFKLSSELPNSGAAHDVEPFTINGNYYIAVAKYRVNSIIYKWNGAGFDKYQTVPTSGAFDLEAFRVNGKAYLAVANNKNEMSNYYVASVIYQWNGTRFVPFQTIPTHGATAIKFFDIDNTQYLAIVNAKATVNSLLIRKWSGAEFAAFQTLNTSTAYDVEHFAIDGRDYLAVANHRRSNRPGYSTNSHIYEWSGSKFEEYQTIHVIGSKDVHAFSAGNRHFVIFANHSHTDERHSRSMIYEWTSSSKQLVLSQIIPTNAVKWTSAEIDENLYLFSAEWDSRDGSGKALSGMYKWTTHVCPFQRFSTRGARIVKPFRISHTTYMAVAQSRARTCPIYEWK